MFHTQSPISLCVYQQRMKGSTNVGKCISLLESESANVQSKLKLNATRDLLSWCPSRLKGFLGVSGPYNLLSFMEHLHSRGYKRELFVSMIGGLQNAPLFSPTLCLQNALTSEAKQSDDSKSCSTFAAHLCPNVYLFHGSADRSAHPEQTIEFAGVLRRLGVLTNVALYPGKSHTDPILEDPIMGKDPLLADMLTLICGKKTEVNAPALMPRIAVAIARFVNPF
jgi:prenylcysteine alpha-carboxyl methylesterase